MAYPSYFNVYNASAGSGKTFTLVKEYLTLLLTPDASTNFQRILAMTFTNKAAGEMKERVLQSLLDFSTMDENSSDDMRQMLLETTGLSQEELKEKSLRILQQILKEYSSFNIKTIDSFTNKLIKSFAFDLGLSMDFEVELDTQAIFQEAVDELVSRIGQDQELTRVLVSFAKDKAEDDRSWDIGRDLFEISQLLLNENHLRELQSLRRKNLKDFKTLYKTLLKEQRFIRNIWQEKGGEALDLIASKGLQKENFLLKGQVPKFFEKLKLGGSDIDFIEGSSIDRNLDSNKFYAKGQPQGVKDAIDEISAVLIALYRESEGLFETYKLNGLILKNLIPLAVLNSINQILEEIKTNNNIRLNAEFNQLISDHLRDQPAAFIYERIGEKFKHFFIDEMQDTSVLQWLNMIPLLNNALSGERAGVMLVGDAKQAIYRWRGGKAEQFIDLSSVSNLSSNPFMVKREVKNLDTNFRSYAQIIGFNNDFFTSVSGFFSDPSYRELYQNGNEQKFNKREGGYVELNFLEGMKNNAERDENYPLAVIETVQDLLPQFRPSEICILVRKKAQGATIAKMLVDRGIEILSSETLLLKNNAKIEFIIQFLKFQSDPSNQEALFEVLTFLYKHLKVSAKENDFYAEFLELGFEELIAGLKPYGIDYSTKNFSSYSVYEGVEAIIRGFKLNSSSDAFLQFFLDFVYDFTQRRSQKGVDFLEYWEEKKDNLNIVNSDDLEAVRIMTIHKSKGLEFPVVIFPYDMEIHGDRSPKAWYKPLEGEAFKGFDSLLVSATSGIQKTGDRGREIFEESHKEQELDSINLLYVCLTRAIEQLYVITEKRKQQNTPKYTSDLFFAYLNSIQVWNDEQQRYSFGDKLRVSQASVSSSKVEEQRQLISTAWQEHDLHLVSKSSILWDSTRGDAIEYGNLIHEMLSAIYDVNDLPRVVRSYRNRGLLKDAEKNNVEKILTDVVTNTELKSFFESGLKVRNERPILASDRMTVIPDRLVFRDNKVWVIDYKTGTHNSSHEVQIDHYGSVLTEMGYEVEERILVYINDPVKVVKRPQQLNVKVT